MTFSASEIEGSTNMFLPLQIVNLWLEVAKNYFLPKETRDFIDMLYPLTFRSQNVSHGHQMVTLQGLVNVPFWEDWTSPYSSYYRPYT